MSRRDEDLEQVRRTYARYDEEGRARLWDPSNRGYARLARDRDRALVGLIEASIAATPGPVLDLGCGDGRLLTAALSAGVRPAEWHGVDLDADGVAAAASAHPEARFVVGSADELELADGSVAVVVAATLFSSLPSATMEADVAREIGRVLAPGGFLIWYDLRYDNPRNSNVHGLGVDRIRRLFPGWEGELRPITLLPPLARRLGLLTSVLYPALHALPVLRSHLVGRLRRPTSG